MKCFEELAVSWFASGGRDTPPMRQDGENKKIPSSSDEEEGKSLLAFERQTLEDILQHQFPSPWSSGLRNDHTDAPGQIQSEGCPFCQERGFQSRWWEE